MITILDLKNEIYESDLRMFDLSSQTNPWNTENKADIEYLNCHYGKWYAVFVNVIMVLKFKNETYESDQSLFELSSTDNRTKHIKQSWLWFVTRESELMCFETLFTVGTYINSHMYDLSSLTNLWNIAGNIDFNVLICYLGKGICMLKMSFFSICH